MTTESMIETGGPAFPMSAHPDHGYGPAASVQCGMDLRDYFAAKALSAFMVTELNERQHTNDTKAKAVARYAKHAYFVADAMLEARKGGAA